MSKQKGVIKLEGNLDGISFYQAGGRHLARMANGPSKEKIMKDPRYERTRENMSEFAGAGMAGKAFRMTFNEVVKSMAGSYFAASLTQLFKQVLSGGPGERGKRSVEVLTHKQKLIGLELNKSTPFSSICSVDYNTTLNADRNSLELTCALQPLLQINRPSAANHYRLVLAIGTLCDYIHNANTQKYEASVPDLNGKSAVVYSAMQPFNSGTQVISLTAALAGAPVISADVAMIVCVGIEFFQEVNSINYALKQANAMRIDDVL